ncbi:MAG: ATP-binding cassette domain-containing protein [Anaeromyxobacteraceae bacterium]
MPPVIEVAALRKVFRVTKRSPGLAGAVAALVRPRREEVVAVDGIDLAVEPGEAVGYIGVNGAGKSTTVKLLTGILAPTSGTVRVLGRDPQRERVANAREIGVVFGQRTQLWWDLPVVESLGLLARVYGVAPARQRELLARFDETLGLGELLGRPVRQLSLGQRMRAELAATLLHEPRVVYLDEPTIGLDVMVKDRIRAFLKAWNRASGATVVLTTHDLGDIEELCRRVVVIDRGRVLYDGPIARLQERFGREREMAFDLAAAPPAALALPAGVREVERGERRLVLRFDRTAASAPQVTAAVMEAVEVRDFSVRETDLTAIVKAIYGGALGREAG